MGTSQGRTSARWRKSGYNGSTGGECADVASLLAAFRNPHADGAPPHPFAKCLWCVYLDSRRGVDRR